MSPDEFKAIAAASSELVKPIYRDLAQPGVQAIGKALGTIGGVVNAALYPVSLLNAKAEFLLKRNIEKYRILMESQNPENVIEAPVEISIPVVQKLAQTQNEELVRLYLELLASASLSDRVHTAHPAFVQVIANMGPDEAKLIEHFRSTNPEGAFIVQPSGRSGKFCAELSWFGGDVHLVELDFPNNLSAYLSNLTGLGIVESMRVDLDLSSSIWNNGVAAAQRLLPDNVDPMWHLKNDHLGYHVISDFGQLFMLATNSRHFSGARQHPDEEQEYSS